MAITVGSDEAVSAEGFITFPGSVDNKISKFTAMEHGFALSDSTTSCTFDSYFPVGGACALNGGSLYLSHDLVLEHSAYFSSCGLLHGNGHTVYFPRMLNDFAVVPEDNTVSLTFFRTLRALHAVSHFSAVQTTHLSRDGSYGAVGIHGDGGSTAIIYSLSSNRFERVNVVNIVDTIKQVRWHPHEHVLAIGAKDASGNAQLHVYVFDHASSTLIRVETTSIIRATLNSLEWSTDGLFLAATLGKPQPQVRLYSFDKVTSALTFEGQLDFGITERISDGALAWLPSDKVMALGFEYTEKTDPTLRLVHINKRNRLSTTTHMHFDASVAALDWSRTTSHLVLGLGSGEERIRVVSYNSENASLNEQQSFRIGQDEAVYDVASSPDNAYVALSRTYKGNDEVVVLKTDWDNAAFAKRHTITMDSVVSSIVWRQGGGYVTSEVDGDVTLWGSVQAEEDDVFSLNDIVMHVRSATTFTPTVRVGGTVVMSGEDHQITFNNDVMVAPQSSLVMSGVSLVFHHDAAMHLDATASLSVNNVSFFTDLGRSEKDQSCHVLQDLSFDTTYWRTPMRWCASQPDFVFSFHRDLQLTTTWRLKGNVVFDGGGHVLDVAQGCIVVEDDSAVTFKNMILMNVHNHAISCETSRGSVVSRDVIWVMDDRYTFSQGNLHFYDHTIFEGNTDGGVFEYSSGQKSIVHAYSTVMFDRGVTFSYAPLHCNFSTIEFEHRTAELFFRGCHVYSSGSLTCTLGRIAIQDRVHLFAYPSAHDGIVCDGLLELGDEWGNDCLLSMKAGSILQVCAGKITYRNKKSNSLSLLDDISGFWFNSRTAFHIYEDLYLGRGTIYFQGGSTFAYKQGKNVFGSIHMKGKIYYDVL